ncbi:MULTISPECIES: ABC transporter permease [Paenibacillus]|jgi:NitT/TauT family transport system permease protein|uniref:ABC transporter permease n=1 Tax=Paenibacillus baimaensis TaxID=2982185 RepID=A0ABT2U8Q4_9BACL|nr:MULTISPECIES: ABC transporter permease [unclassified Paenibacillus]MCU6791012.1 ABC transporter permease [Paenibacillus sp. WQ 127069]OMF20955.1 ABC transporter permease [Paenibacillus sp. FSL H7-0331]
MLRLRQVGEYFVAILILVVIWYVYVVAFDVPAFIVPLPSDVGVALIEMFSAQDLLHHFFVTSGEVLAGFVLGIVFGYLVGYLIGRFKFLEEALMPYILLAQTAPKIALAPLFVIWFGLGFTSKLMLIVSMVFFPVMLGAIFGLKSVTYNLKCLMQITGLNWWQKIIQVELPYSLPQIFAGLKVGMVQAVIAAIVAEWISGESGLGYLLVFNSTTYNSPMLFASIIYTIVVGIIFYALISFLENRFLFWHDSKQVK